MKLNPVTIVGSVVLGVGGFWGLIGAGVQRHYDPGQGSITSAKDIGYFAGVEIGSMGNAIGNVFFEKELLQKGAIENQQQLQSNPFCYPWDNQCKLNNRQILERQHQQEQIQQRRQSY